MKKIFLPMMVLNLIIIELCVLNAVNIKDDDKYVESALYVFPENVASGNPVQAEVKNVKIRELDKQAIFALNQNIDQFIFESEELSYSPMADNILEGLYDSKQMKMGKPVYIKGRELAIRNMPVLDQGNSDTCATFSSTAALDILSGNGEDTYSNYMSLCLGHALSLNMISAGNGLLEILRTIKTDSLPNPWEGSEGFIIMSQFKDFGLVEKKDDNSQNGLFGNVEKKQPLIKNQLQTFKKIPDFEYTLLYHKNFSDIKKIYKSESDFVKAVKNELNKGNIVSIGLIIASEYPSGNNGMTGNVKIMNRKAVFTSTKQKNKADYNTWCSDSALGRYIKKNEKNENLVGSHQMIIIGYIDNQKNKNDGVFIVRNSWGVNAGDKGNNYITYKYAYFFSDELLTVSVKSTTLNKTVFL